VYGGGRISVALGGDSDVTLVDDWTNPLGVARPLTLGPAANGVSEESALFAPLLWSPAAAAPAGEPRRGRRPPPLKPLVSGMCLGCAVRGFGRRFCTVVGKRRPLRGELEIACFC